MIQFLYIDNAVICNSITYKYNYPVCTASVSQFHSLITDWCYESCAIIIFGINILIVTGNTQAVHNSCLATGISGSHEK